MPQSIIKVQEKLNLAPVMFFDLQYSRESASETSKQNKDEVRFIRELLFVLARQISTSSYNATDMSALKGSIGIISPYKSQVRELKASISKVKNKLCIPGDTDIEINTVDGY